MHICMGQDKFCHQRRYKSEPLLCVIKHYYTSASTEVDNYASERKPTNLTPTTCWNQRTQIMWVLLYCQVSVKRSLPTLFINHRLYGASLMSVTWGGWGGGAKFVALHGGVKSTVSLSVNVWMCASLLRFTQLLFIQHAAAATKRTMADWNQLTHLTHYNRSWKADGFSASQEMSQILRNSKLYYCVYNSPYLLPILSQINPVHTLTASFFNTHFNIILSVTSKYSKGCPCCMFPDQNLESICFPPPHTCYMPHPFQLPGFYCLKNIWWIKVMRLLSSPSNLLLPPPSKTQVSSSAPFSQTTSAYILPLMRKTKFHSHVKLMTRLQFCVS